MKSITIVKFTKNDKGVSVTINNTETINVLVGIAETINVLVGIAETIQLISKETKQNKESIISDINKILDILEKEEEK
ncbi:MAG: hypothetical protein UIT70_06830 [Clostridia bacterium]|nr:hypothetical protein [Clostridia bacterium]